METEEIEIDLDAVERIGAKIALRELQAEIAEQEFTKNKLLNREEILTIIEKEIKTYER